jgi:hypothetical protein
MLKVQEYRKFRPRRMGYRAVRDRIGGDEDHAPRFTPPRAVR